jgi:hypothetical protein
MTLVLKSSTISVIYRIRRRFRLGITQSKFYDWRKRYGKVNEHNSWIPRDRWLED